MVPSPSKIFFEVTVKLKTAHCPTEIIFLPIKLLQPALKKIVFWEKQSIFSDPITNIEYLFCQIGHIGKNVYNFKTKENMYTQHYDSTFRYHFA